MISIKPLTQLGLSEKEARVYITLQQEGESPPSHLALRLDIPRATIYEALSNLEKQGLVIKSSNKPKRYKAAEPNKLRTLQQKKINQVQETLNKLEQALPKLNTSYKQNPNPNVKLYEGDEGVLNVYHQILALKSDLYMYNSFQELPDSLQDFWSGFPSLRKDKFACYSIISAEPQIDRENIIESWKEWNSHIKDRLFLVDENEFPSPGNIYIQEGLTVFLIFRPEIMAITIRNQEIAETMLVLHKLARENAEKITFLKLNGNEN